MKELLSQKEIKFAYLDITSSMLYLKMFLKLRDNRPEFQSIRANGQVGIPCIVHNDEKLFFEDEVEAFLKSIGK